MHNAIVGLICSVGLNSFMSNWFFIMVILSWFQVCLVPVSAHGTNPASAQVAGLKVVYVPTSADGSVSMEDFRKKVCEREWVSE